MPISSLTPADLRLTVDPDALGFADTSELLEHTLPWIGACQERTQVISLPLVNRLHTMTSASNMNNRRQS